MDFFFRALLKNDSSLAYKGSTWIRNAGLPTIEPMATWLTGPAFNSGLESRFLYRPVEAEHSPTDSQAQSVAYNFSKSSRKPALRIGKRHQVFGSKFSSSRWKLGA